MMFDGNTLVGLKPESANFKQVFQVLKSWVPSEPLTRNLLKTLAKRHHKAREERASEEEKLRQRISSLEAEIEASKKSRYQEKKTEENGEEGLFVGVRTPSKVVPSPSKTEEPFKGTTEELLETLKATERKNDVLLFEVSKLKEELQMVNYLFKV